MRTLPCAEHFCILAFAQLTYRESLRDIEVCLSAQAAKRYHMGIRSPVSRSILADANEHRDWQIYADFAQRLIAQARRLYADEDLGLELSNTVYVMDRGYPDFERLFALHQAGAFFVTRAKSNMNFRRVCSAPSDRAQGINCDQTILLVGVYSKRDYPVHLRRIRFKDPESGKTLVFLTNLFGPTAATICALYKSRWPVELFFKWIKQHLRIKQFYGTSENAVKTQIWIAISVYVLVAIVKKKLHLDASLYTLLQIFSVTLFEKIPLNKEFLNMEYSSSDPLPHNQLNLFDS